MDQITISIIGTAGRRHQNSDILTKDIFDRMIEKTVDIINNISPDKKNIILVSGGSSWSDHIAVRLFLLGYCESLILYLPCEWDKDKFLDNGTKHWASNPGQTLNYYHNLFYNKTGINSLNDIEQAIKLGAKININFGFHTRNTLVAKSDYLIAFGLDKGTAPNNGGTLDTWNKSKSIKQYVNICTL